jgi:capsid assembly protease
MIEGTPYALAPAAYAELRAAVEAAARGQPVTALSFGNTKRGLPAEGAGHVAVIPVHGLVMKNPAEWHRKHLGAMSTQDLHTEFEAAMANPDVHAVLLHVDSPGGTVDGTQSLADHIYNSRNRGKPIHAVVDGLGASAAYWIASGAHKVYAATPTTQVGSVGVLSTHVDVSKALDNAGVKVTHVVSGPYKGLGSTSHPLGDDARSEMQHMVDGIHAEFAAHVAKARGLSKDALAKVANGRVFLASDAAKHGLVDGVKGFARATADLAAHAAASKPVAAAKAPAVKLNATDVALRAAKYRAEQLAKGNRISTADAVAYVSNSI